MKNIKKITLICFAIYNIFFSFIMLANTPNDDTIIAIDDSSVVSNQAGTYPVKITYLTTEGLTIEKIIYITIYYPKTNRNDQYREAIDAHDIELSENILFDLNDEELIRLSNAHAWSLIDGTLVPITKIERRVVNQKQGIYHVQFWTEHDTSITIQVLYREQIPNYLNRVTYLYFDSITYKNYYYAVSIIFILLFLTIIVASIHLKKLYNKSKKINELLYLQKNK